jgi:DNA polymerase-3 subunit alpha (Gram-positive type)
MVKAIKIDNNYSRIIKYLVLDEEKKKCIVIKNSKRDSNNPSASMEEFLAYLKELLDDSYELVVLEELSLENEIKLLWPHLAEVIQEKYPYINGFLERARLQVKANRVLIEVETEMAYKYLNEEKIRDFIAKELGGLLQEELVLEIENGDLLKDISMEIDLEEYERKVIEKKSPKPSTPKAKNSAIIYGKKISREKSHNLNEIQGEIDHVIVEGLLFDLEEIKSRRGNSFFLMDITDKSNSITVKLFPRKGQDPGEGLKTGQWIRVEGYVERDQYSRELTLVAESINNIDDLVEKRQDQAEEKRIELHLHTRMSAMDSVVDVGQAIARAAAWGHPAIAITDHGVVQAYPDAYWAGKKHGIKILYGLEAYLVDDGEDIIYKPGKGKIKDYTYVVFDFETTGLNSRNDEIIEIGGVKLEKGQIVDTFSSFVLPRKPVPDYITRITGISQEMLKGAPAIEDIIPEFMEFIGDAVLVAHNASFDYGFLKNALKKTGFSYPDNSVLDTLALSRALYPRLKNHKLNTLAEELGVSLDNHHRAVDDATATAGILLKMLAKITEEKISKLEEINKLSKNIDWRDLRTYHLIIFARNKEGLRDLYKLVSSSHIKHFYRVPRILKSELVHVRDNLLIGSACEAGQLFRAILENMDEQEINKIARFYDFLEIQPLGNNEFLLGEKVESLEELKKINKRIYQLGKKLKKPVVATGDVHFLDPEDSIYREILQAGQGYEEQTQAPLYFRTTGEMLEEFSYFGEEIARELVIENPRKIADLCEEIQIIPDKLFTPSIEGAEEEIKEMSLKKARELYGDPLPDLVEKRLNRELNSIIGNGYAVIYLTAQKLVQKSLEDGYLVGSRGSVGSSFVATMTGITEVNPLPPHYRCSNCKYTDFITDGSVGVGPDLPDRDCPECGEKLTKDGFDIPFEVFMGFEGDKVPDIDLNFSGEYQSIIHKYTEQLFGEDHVFRAGTISSIAERTAYGFVRGYLDERGLVANNAEIKRLVKGCSGVKRTTGQHPGGQIVVPADMEIYDFTPIQRPANDMNSEVLTTHFDFNSIHENLLKLDVLGHDDPTIIRMLQDLTGVSPFDIPLDDPATMAIFSGTESLGLSPEELGTTVGTLGIPEFGTSFVRQMLVDTRPTTFSELVRISGLSHGTDVWLNNAQELIRKGVARLSEVISVRDDIMNYLILKGLEPARAFKIMENVRKGRGLSEDDEKYMLEKKIPQWYIESCKKIKYMFPKAHAAAYVMMAFRIAYFKVHHPEAFYATYFTVKADDFDAQIVCQGYDFVLAEKQRIEAKGNDITAKERNTLTVLEVVLEAMVRGIKFIRVDLYRSDIRKFQITEEGLLPPLISLVGLGESAAQNIAATREEYEFTSIEDLANKARISKIVIEVMKEHGVLKGLPEKNQLSLF